MRRAWAECVAALLIMGQSGNATAWTDRYATERYPLSELQVRSIERRGATTFAYLSDKEGFLHHVGQWEFVGSGHAAVRNIDACGLWLEEVSRIGEEQWNDRYFLLKGPDYDKLAACKRREKAWQRKTKILDNLQHKGSRR